MSRPLSVSLARLVVALAAAWAAVSLAREAALGFQALSNPQGGGLVLAWRLGSRPAERLRRCLDEARTFLPRGSTVTFASPPGPLDADFFRWRWAAYLLPDLDVVRPTDRPASSRYLIAYHLDLNRRDLALVHELSACGRLYRIDTR